MLLPAHIYFGSSYMSVESNCSNHMDPVGTHPLFNCSTGVPSSSFVLQLLEFGFPHYKKHFLEVGYSSLEKVVPECMVSGQAGLTLLQHLKNVGLA